MEWSDLPLILTAIGGPTTVIALYRKAKADARAELLAEQAKEAVEAKNAEIEALRAREAACLERNTRLWNLMDGLTRPPGRS